MVRKLQNVSSPRSTDQGLSTVFKASFADGSGEEISCDSGHLDKIIVRLRGFAYAAAMLRERLPEHYATINPFEVRSVDQPVLGHNGMIALQFQVTEGMPIQLAMTADLAKTMMELVEPVLDLAKDPRNRPRGN